MSNPKSILSIRVLLKTHSVGFCQKFGTIFPKNLNFRILGSYFKGCLTVDCKVRLGEVKSEFYWKRQKLTFSVWLQNSWADTDL